MLLHTHLDREISKVSGPKKRFIKILAGEMVLEVTNEAGGQENSWRQILGDTQGSWTVRPKRDD